MIRSVSRIAAPAVVAVASVVLFGGPALGGDTNQDGPDGPPGSATVHCDDMPPPEPGVQRCTARAGSPGAGGAAVDD